MIKVTNDCGGDVLTPLNKTPEDALRHLILAELAFSGRITELAANKVVVETYVFGRKDISSFEGLPIEMDALYEAAYTSLSLTIADSPELKQKQLDDVIRFTKGNPRLLDMGAEMIAGASSAKIIMASMIGDKENAEKILRNKSDDIFAALSLIRFEGVPVADAVALLN